MCLIILPGTLSTPPHILGSRPRHPSLHQEGGGVYDPSSYEESICGDIDWYGTNIMTCTLLRCP